MKTSEILDKAADVIAERGWLQGSFCGPAGRSTSRAAVDVLGAIGVAAHGKPWHLAGAEPAIKALAARIGVMPNLQIAVWNDQPGRTAEQVIVRLREAAASERGAGR